MHSCALTQPHSLSWGERNHVFTDDNNKYYCIGAQPGQAERGVQSGLYKLKYGCGTSDWDAILNMLKCTEHAFNMFGDTDVIWHLVKAWWRVNFVIMESSHDHSSSKHLTAAWYYNGVSFSINVYIIQVDMETQYHFKDDKVCYLCFPRIGVAVALHPGDFLMFNLKEPHSISSHCNTDYKLYCISPT